MIDVPVSRHGCIKLVPGRIDIPSQIVINRNLTGYQILSIIFSGGSGFQPR